MEQLILFIVLMIVVYAVLKSFIKKIKYSKQQRVYQYRRKQYLMTQSENEFFHMLTSVAEERYYVFPQVHLSAILDHKVTGQNWKSAFRHINGKSVDFVLCDKTSLKPVYAVELDDMTHNATIRQNRDQEVERIFEGANLPLIRFSNYKTLSQDDIAQRFWSVRKNP